MKLLKTKRFLLRLINRIKNKLSNKKSEKPNQSVTRNRHGFPRI